MSSNSSLLFPSCGAEFTMMAFFIVYVCLLPVFIFILYVGCQRWRKRSSGSSSSHADVFTYHMVIIELIGIIVVFLCLVGVYTKQFIIVWVAIILVNATQTTPVLFHVLTCVECYLAVIHPVTYRGLKSRGVVWIRNVSIGCIWLLSVALMFVASQPSLWIINISLYLCLLVFAVVAVCYCCLSVLCALVRPKPGDVGGTGVRGDHSKKRAFRTMIVILGALLVKFMIRLVSSALEAAGHSFFVICSLLPWMMGLHLPSSLVLPLLFLQRAGKLPGCKQKSARAA